jgi:hypothetical protein
MIDDGVGVASGDGERVFALVFSDTDRVETHGIYTSVSRATRAFVSLATAGLIDAHGGQYSLEEYPLDQPHDGTVVLQPADLLSILAASLTTESSGA